MKVYVYPADLTACGYYRLTWPAMHLQEQGYDIKIMHPSRTDRVTGVINDETGQLQSISAPKDADVMVFQRVTSKLIEQAVPIWRANGIAVVVDVDDDMSAIHPNNPVWNVLHPTTGGKMAEYDWNAAQRIYEAATYVTASTEPLIEKYAPIRRPGDPRKGVVLKNCVPENATKIQGKQVRNLVGWGGNARTHPDDPQVLGPSIARLQKEGVKFRIVGPSVGVRETFTLNTEPEITGGVELAQWHHEIAKFSVGIAPLSATKFNAAKSWLKMLEYAAVGVPCVGSPRPEYQRLHALGIGLLAKDPRDWYRHVRRLLDDDELRLEMSQRGREIVAAKFTVEANAWRWWEAWETAFKLQRQSATNPFKRPIATTTARHERGPQTS